MEYVKRNTDFVSTSPRIYVRQAETRRKIARLEEYVEDNLLSGQRFVCASKTACRKSCAPEHVFIPGTMNHVGRHFDLRRGDKPLRVVVVGQEAKDRKVTLDKRYKQVHDRTGLSERQYKQGEYPGRNPHMRGTTWALRVIFGQDLGTDFEGEFVHPATGTPFHIFDGFALVNRLLCYAGPENGVQARATRTMLDNCATHLSATLSILKPTILILQGKKAAHGTEPVLTTDHIYNDHLYAARLGNHRMMVCTFSHPSAHGDLRWADRSDYLINVVGPNLRKALQHS